MAGIDYSTLFRVSNSLEDNIMRMFDNFAFRLRVASPAVVKSFNPDMQTITAQLCIDESVYGEITAVPVLPDIPVYMFGTKNFSITAPIKEGDECLLIFADTCIDDWFVRGGTGRKSKDIRRHSLNDPFALVGFRSQPNAKTLVAYNEDDLEIRNEDRSVRVTVADDKITLAVGDSTTSVVEDGTITIDTNGTTVVIKDGEVTITSTKINLGASSGLKKLIDERLIAIYNAHFHTDTTTAGVTGQPTVSLVAANCATINTEAK